ncbi:hypothetical protein J8J27_30175, partial [Mycobacterium tuberculosis]|nr:hypothetical protein [Mycobacterium tuberculosis]
MPSPALSRRSLLFGSTAIAGAALLPLRPAFAAGGGRLTVATDSEPRNLNPAIVASNGVFFVASK